VRENIEIVKAIILSVASAMRANALIATKKKMPDVALILQTECNNLENAYQELDQCSSSSAGCGDASDTTSHGPSSAPCSNQDSGNLAAKDSTVAPAAASPAKWSSCRTSNPRWRGHYLTRLATGDKTVQSLNFYWTGGGWECGEEKITPSEWGNYEYFDHHLIGDK